MHLTATYRAEAGYRRRDGQRRRGTEGGTASGGGGQKAGRSAETVQGKAGRLIPEKTAPAGAGGGFDGTERAGTRSGGRKQGRNSADGCGEDRA